LTTAAPCAASRLGNLDFDPPTVELGVVQAGDGIVGFLGCRHFDEPEAA
jgi:hypothetical protein